MIGKSGADGTTMALAAANAPTAAEALNLLAASSAVANMGVERASSLSTRANSLSAHANSLSARATIVSGLATEGLRNSDSTYEKRFKRYDEELQRLKDKEIELQQLHNRVTFLEGLLGRVLHMMQSGNIDAAEVRMLCNMGGQQGLQFWLTLFWLGGADDSKPWYLTNLLDIFCWTWAFVTFDDSLGRMMTIT